MGDIEKPLKTHLVSKAAAPETWYIKFLRPVCRKPHCNEESIDLVDESSSVIKKSGGKLVVENIYKCKPYVSPKFAIVPIEMSGGASPMQPEASLLRAFSESKSYILPDEVKTMGPKHGRRKSFSFFSFLSLGRLCNVAGESENSSLARHNEPPSGGRLKHRKGSRTEPGSRSSAWFLLRCVGTLSSRSRRSRQGSMEHLKKAVDAADDSSCVTEPVDAAVTAATGPLKFESWTGDDPKVWSMDLTAYGEVVKCLVEDAPPTSTLSDIPPNLKASSRSDMISETETDDAPMIREDEFEEFDAPGTAPWSLSVSSSREFWRKEKKSTLPECTSNALVPYSGELDSVDIGNISDSQSLLRAKVFGAEMFRKQCQLEMRREEETKKLLFSLDEALDQYNHKRITTDNSASEPEDDSKCESPNYELFNSPVFESFLESSTKAWETDSRTLRLLDAAEPGIRELHCVTVQPPNLIVDTVRKPKRSLSVCEDRIHHPQGEEHMILNLARLQMAELNARKKRGTDTGVNPAPKPRSRGYKQQRSLQNGAGSSSVSPLRPPIPTGNVIKESVAVVVESSYDPYADFRESMIDMIVDQNIQQTSDLEELLQCYLALNEPDYHQVIIEVFSDVWHELFQKEP